MQAADREGRAATAAAAVEEREPMPQYEYICDEDGEVLTLLRPMRSADDPVEDPEGRGRSFRRKHSVFGVSGGSGDPSATSLPVGGCCPCGKNAGGCGMGGH